MHRRAASMTRCSCVPRRSGPTNVIVRQIYPLCLAVNRSQCVMGHSTAPAVESAEDAGEQFGPHALGDLAGIGQVPPALVADEAEQHASHVVGGLLGLHARPEVLALQVRDEETPDEDEDAFAL